MYMYNNNNERGSRHICISSPWYGYVLFFMFYYYYYYYYYYYLGIITGNPGVFPGYPDPYPIKPVPMERGRGFAG